MTYLNRISLTVLVKTHIACSCPQTPAAPLEAYEYCFSESTNANHSIIVNGAQRGIKFDRPTSDKAALDALHSLKWNILYPNANRSITIYGTYHEEVGEFSLTHWFLPTPFKAFLGDAPFKDYPGDPLGPDDLVVRNGLIRSDFQTEMLADPHIYNSPP
jgi:hypothetical protein